MNHHTCLFHAFGLDKISLSGTVCCHTVRCDQHWDILTSSFYIFNFHPWRYKIIGWWHLLALLVFDIEAVEWWISQVNCLFFITSVSSSPSVVALCQFSPHWVSANPVCSTEFFSSFIQFLQHDRSILTEHTHAHSLNPMLAKTHTHWGSWRLTIWAHMGASLSVPNMLVICFFLLWFNTETSYNLLPITNAHIPQPSDRCKHRTHRVARTHFSII